MAGLHGLVQKEGDGRTCWAGGKKIGENCPSETVAKKVGVAAHSTKEKKGVDQVEHAGGGHRKISSFTHLLRLRGGESRHSILAKGVLGSKKGLLPRKTSRPHCLGSGEGSERGEKGGGKASFVRNQLNILGGNLPSPRRGKLVGWEGSFSSAEQEKLIATTSRRGGGGGKKKPEQKKGTASSSRWNYEKGYLAILSETRNSTS